MYLKNYCASWVLPYPTKTIHTHLFLSIFYQSIYAHLVIRGSSFGAYFIGRILFLKSIESKVIYLSLNINLYFDQGSLKCSGKCHGCTVVTQVRYPSLWRHENDCSVNKFIFNKRVIVFGFYTLKVISLDRVWSRDCFAIFFIHVLSGINWKMTKQIRDFQKYLWYIIFHI